MWHKRVCHIISKTLCPYKLYWKYVTDVTEKKAT